MNSDNFKKLLENINSKIILPIVDIIKLALSLLSNFRLIGIMCLIFITIASLFSWKGASINNEIIILCGMIFLSSVFSELKSWNLWGFKGKNRQLEEIPQSGAIATNKEKPAQNAVNEAENQKIELMRYDKGNFLELAFEIERLLRTLATVTLARDIPSNIDTRKLVEDLQEIGMVTDIGKQQIEGIRWLRNLLVHGRDSEINQQTLNDGIRLAFSFYSELYSWLNTPKT